jgi:hypothetical protein
MIGSPNLLEIEDMVKGLPDQMLLQQAQAPSGQIPQFLLVSEIQRRSDMRKKYEAQQAQPEATVADQIVQEGIMSTRPPMQPQMPMQQMPMEQPMMPPMGQPQGIAALPSPEMGMAEGGIVRMREGGDMLRAGRSSLLRDEDDTEERISKAQERYLRYGFPASLLPFNRPGGLFSSPMNITSDLIASEREKQLREAGLIDIAEPKLSSEDRKKLALRETEFYNQALQNVNKGDMPEESVIGNAGGENINKPNVGVSRKDLIAGLGSDTEQMSKDAAAKTSANVQGGGKEVQATSAVSKLMNLLGTPKEVPKIDDLIQETKDEALSGALMSLGAGIASGNLSQGITAAGKTALDARGKARALEAEQRLAEAKAIDDVTARDIGILGTMAGLEIDREKIAADIDIAATALSRELAKQTALDEREAQRSIAALAKSLLSSGTMKQTPGKDGKIKYTPYTVDEAVTAAAAALGMSVPANMEQIMGGGSGNANKYADYSIVR